MKESPEHGKGRERIEVLAGAGTNVTDGRGRAGMRAARAQGLGKEPDPLETAATSEALLEVCWLEPIPSQEMKCYKRGKNWQDSEVKGQEIPRSGLRGA